MHTERYLWSAILWSLVGFGVFLCRRRSPLFLPTLALLATGLIGSFYALATTFVTPLSWRNISHLGDELIVATQQEYVAFAAGLLLAVWFAINSNWIASTPRELDEARADDPGLASRDFAVAAALVAIGGSLYALYVQRVGLGALSNRDDYAAKYLLSQGLGPLQFGLWMAIAGCLWAEAAPLPRFEKNCFRPVAVAIAVWSIAVISVRTNFAILLLGYLAIHCRRNGWQLRRVHPGLIALALVTYACLETFALFRGAYKGDVGEALWLIQGQGMNSIAAAIGGSELSHPFITAAEVLYDREAGELAGRSLLDGVLAFVPRGIHPDRPLMLSEQFVREHYVELASRGGGAAFSLVAEGWLDFGSLFGPFVFGCAMGWLLFWVERRWDCAPHGFVARVAPYFAFYVAVQHRNEFATLAKQVFILTAAVVPVWIAGRAAATVLASRSFARVAQPFQR
jgi:hypothetical protein